MSTLIFFSQQQHLFEFHLTNARSHIGRSDSCDIALPGSTLSRVHCLVERRGSRWFLLDKSRHGTWVDGNRIGCVQLSDGDEFHMGSFRVRFQLQSVSAPETTELVNLEPYAFVDSASEELLVTRAVLTVDGGAENGKQFPLNSSRLTIGGAGSDIVLCESLMTNHCVLRVSRGRTMIEPGMGPAYLNGQRIQEVTPIYTDEEVRLGRIRFRMESLSNIENNTSNSFGDMIGESEAMRVVFGRLQRFAAHDFPVLILGESGTGKELAANGIHFSSHRRSGPFVVLNCGAISENLLESELFGYVKGAFTGADSDREGAFQQADGGTLFLDELGEMSEMMQVKLLRVLESGEVRRVGSNKTEFPDVRVVAATNADLQQSVEAGKFRADLFFRLSVLSIELPPLRERTADIPYLARKILSRLDPGFDLTEDALLMLKAYPWRGNVRELRNVIVRAFVLGFNPITDAQIRFFGINEANSKPAAQLTGVEAERYYLRDLLRKHNGNKAAMAREIGIARTTLLYRLKRTGLS